MYVLYHRLGCQMLIALQAYEHRQKAAKDTYLADKAAYETLLKGESEEAAVLVSPCSHPIVDHVAYAGLMH